MKYFLKCLYNFANFKGRARRKEFWYFVLYSGIIIALWNVSWIWFANSISPKTVNQYLQEHIGVDALFVYPLVYVLLVFPFVMVISRRVNDTGIPFHVFMKRIWCIIGVLAIIAVVIKKGLSFFGYDDIDFEALVVRFAIPFLLVPFCYFLYCMAKKGTPGDNPYGPDPRIDDPIENARKIPRMDDGDSESNLSSDNDSDPFAPKR